MPIDKGMTDCTVYLDGKPVRVVNITEITPLVKPIGDLDSVPHYRCGFCRKAIVIYQDDEKPDECRWCGCGVDWESVNEKDG